MNPVDQFMPYVVEKTGRSERSYDIYSRLLEDRIVFPEGSAVLDCALLMRGIDHEWHAREPLYCGEAAAGS